MNPISAPWPVTSLATALSITCHPAPVLDDPDLEAAIEAQWHDALKAHPGLYNGRVFCLSSLSPDALSGFWCEYRWVLAQMRAPELAARLNLRSLAVTGLLLCPDGVVLGRRNPNSLYLPGYWQGVPAGSVEAREDADTVDLGAQLLAELDEEVGLSGAVTLSGPLLACEHDHTHIVDLGFMIRTDLSFAAIRAAWQARANDEYDQIACHERHLVASLSGHVLPTTKAMLERLDP
ncbi:hypothetical protein [Asaia sp. VD9]|uniref:hypothetical protein n=1 Tax=Asaia sp. VD9 TaxID=3081235 RepID=UPI003018BBC7